MPMQGGGRRCNPFCCGAGLQHSVTRHTSRPAGSERFKETHKDPVRSPGVCWIIDTALLSALYTRIASSTAELPTPRFSRTTREADKALSLQRLVPSSCLFLKAWPFLKSHLCSKVLLPFTPSPVYFLTYRLFPADHFFSPSTYICVAATSLTFLWFSFWFLGLK